jgi:hypothetical protein
MVEKTIKSIEVLLSPQPQPEVIESEINMQKSIKLHSFQNKMPPRHSRWNCNIKSISIVTFTSGEVAIKYSLFDIFRAIHYHPYPCLESKKYEQVLPRILRILGEEWWSRFSHLDLYHFKSIKSYEEITDKSIECINYDDMVSPCHQLVMTVLMCNRDFTVPLPESVMCKILGFLPQTLFRCGDVVNCYPVDDFEDNA